MSLPDKPEWMTLPKQKWARWPVTVDVHETELGTIYLDRKATVKEIVMFCWEWITTLIVDMEDERYGR